MSLSRDNAARSGAVPPERFLFREAAPQKEAAPARLREECLTGAEIRAASGTGGTGVAALHQQPRRPQFVPKKNAGSGNLCARGATCAAGFRRGDRRLRRLSATCRGQETMWSESASSGSASSSAENAGAHRDAGRMHALRIAGDERVPPVEIVAVRDQAVGAGRRQPVELGEIVRRSAARSRPRARCGSRSRCSGRSRRRAAGSRCR